MLPSKYINIAKDFSADTGGRFIADTKYSGEEFRDRILIPALGEATLVVIDMDGSNGYLQSFLEEVFGGVVRKLGPSVIDRIQIISTDLPSRAKKAQQFMAQAAIDRN